MKKNREVAHSLERLESPFLDNELFVRETGDDWKARAAAVAAQSPFLRTFDTGITEAEADEASYGFELETVAGLQDKLTHLSLFPHWVKEHGKDVEVTPSTTDPGIYDGPVRYKIAAALQKCLNAVMDTQKFRHIRVALVDLTKDVTKPEFAGFNHKQPEFAASVPKMAAMLAAFQLRHDLRVAQKNNPAPTLAELYSRMRDDWAATQLDPGGTATKFSGGISLRGKLVLLGSSRVALVDSKGRDLSRSPRLEKIFAEVPAGNPVGIDFSSTKENRSKLRELIKAFRIDEPATWKHLDSLGFLERLRVTMGGLVPASNYTTSTIVADVGFPYIASTLLQTGLFDLNRNGGVWLGLDYWGTAWIAAPGGGSVQNATAGSAAALMTLLVQGRVTDTLSSSEMRVLIQKTPLPATHPELVSWFEEGFKDLPGGGNIKTALSKLGVLAGIDDSAFFEREVNDGKGKKRLLRYVAVGLRASKKEELKALILELDKCILANNNLTPADGGHPEEHEADLPYGLSEAPSSSSFALDEEAPERQREAGPRPLTEEEAGIIGGRDDRVPVQDSLAIPFRWICHIWAQKRIKTPGHEEKRGLAPAGTGLLISPRHVLTAAHVLRNVDEKGSVVEEQEAFHVEVALAANGGYTPFGRIEATSWELAPKWNPAAHSSQYDYAVITLNEAVGDKTHEALKGQRLSFWGSPTCRADTSVDALPSAVAKKLIGTRVLTAGFPKARKAEMWCVWGKLSAGDATDDQLIKQGIVEDWSRKAGVFFVTADATEGQSGSPVWVVDGGKRYLVGILVSVGEKDYNTVLNLREEVLRQILRWTGQTSPSEIEDSFEQPEWLQEESTGVDTELATQPEIDESGSWDKEEEGRYDFDTEIEAETGEHSEKLEVEEPWGEENRNSREDEESVRIEARSPAHEEEVLGKDKRTLAADTLRIPNRWICAIDVLVDNPRWGTLGEPRFISRSRATGTLIGPRYVLTVGHIGKKQSIEIDGKTRSVDVRGFTVSPARDGDNYPLGKVAAKSFLVSQQPYSVSRKERVGSRVIEIPVTQIDDYGLIVLKKDVSSSRHSRIKGELRYWGHLDTETVIPHLEPDALNGKEVVVVGYAGDTCGKDKFTGSKAEKQRKISNCWYNRNDEWASTQWRSVGTLRVEINSHRVLHTADTYWGENGAPICLWLDKKPALVGIHADGDTQRNKGVRVTPKMLEEICSWINADAGYPMATIKENTLIVQPAKTGGGKKQPVNAPAKTGTPIMWRDPGDVATRNLTFGIGSETGQPEPPFQFKGEDKSGTNPKIKVIDANGVKWNIKFDEEVHAEVACSRIVWACGYMVEESYFVPSGRVNGVTGADLGRAGKFVGHGSFTNAMFEKRPDNIARRGIHWRWDDNPFNGKAQLHGLGMLAFLLNNWDAKPGNNNVLGMYDDDGSVKEWYLVADWGASLGSADSKWDLAGFARHALLEGTGGKEIRFHYSGHTASGSLGGSLKSVPREHVRWFLGIIEKLTDDQIHDAFRAGGATKEQVNGFTNVIRKRIKELKKAAG